MGSKYFFSLQSLKPQRKFEAGSMTWASSKEVPGFVNISFALLRLNPKGSHEPIWHPNANKIAYCLEGSVLVSVRSPTGVEVFAAQPGDIFFIPQGYIHHIENIGPQEAAIAFACNHANPELMCLSQAIYSLSDEVCNATFETPVGFVEGLKRAKKQELIKTLPASHVPPLMTESKYEYNIVKSKKPVLTKGGYLQLATKGQLPVLDGLGILGFGLNPKGVVEPHWHTNAGELVFIVKGRTRITILAPDGHVEKLEVNAGEGAFAPASHFHNIENIGNENVEVIAFFNHAEPDYIGIAEALGAYENDLLASIFGVAPNYFDAMKKSSSPLVIVPV